MNKSFWKRRTGKKAGGAAPAIPKDNWTVDDVRDALRSSGLALDVNPDTLGPDDLRLLRFDTYKNTVGKKCCCAWLSTKQLLETPQGLVNKRHVKIRTDATERELVDEFCTISLGTLSKTYGSTTMHNSHTLPAFKTHFSPFAFGLSSSQSGGAYAGGFELAAELPIDNRGTPMGPSIAQVHADYGEDIEAARSQKLKHTVRAGDFRHAFKAMEEGL